MLSKLLRFAAPLVAVALFALAPPIVQATTVTYTTSGLFNGGPNTFVTHGGMTISFLAGGATINAPSNIGLGTFHVAGTTTGTFSDTFVLTVNQTVPLPGGSQSFGQASVSGTIDINSSGASVQFTSPLSVTIGTSPAVSYRIASADDSTPGKLNLVSPTTDTGAGQGNTTIQGAVVVPLPATANMGIALLLCLAGAGVWRKVKSSQAVA
jgi:hypothetical protein